MSIANDGGGIFDKLAEVPTDVLAHRFVGGLILCKGNLNEYEWLTAYLIRELRGEPHPQDTPAPQPLSAGESQS